MRLIDADELMKDIENERAYLINTGQIGAEHILVHALIPYISDAPTIDPVRHGEWSHEQMLSTSGGTYAVIRCSECMSQYPMWETNYCPNCGANMDGGEDV